MSSDCCDGEVKSRYISKGEGGSDGDCRGNVLDDDSGGSGWIRSHIWGRVWRCDGRR
jgi:hypothetical protein